MMHDTRSVGFEAHTGDPGAIAFGVGDLVDLAAVVVLLLERTDVGLGRARHNVTSDRIEERGGRDKRSVGGDIETTTVDRPLGEDRKFVIGEFVNRERPEFVTELNKLIDEVQGHFGLKGE
jgi:hypothetical protein